LLGKYTSNNYADTVILAIPAMNSAIRTSLPYQMFELNPLENSHFMPLPTNGIISVIILGYNITEQLLK
jgi:hypothetical protein